MQRPVTPTRVLHLRTAAVLGAALGAFVVLPLCAQSVVDPATGEPPTARVIVKLKADSALLRVQAQSAASKVATRAAALGQRLGVALDAGASVSDEAQVVFATGIASADLARRLAEQSDVEYAVPDVRRHIQTAPNDPLYADGQGGTGPAAGQWYLRAPAGVVQASLDVEPAWAITTGSPGVIVAVLDTGVRFDHPDLMPVAAGGNLLPGYDMITDVATANDGDGRDADASDPGDWVTQADLSRRGSLFQCAPGPEDSNWHGTQTSGLIGALTDNGVGMASIGRNIRVLPVRVLGKCGGFDSDIIAGMRWAAGFPVPGVPANPNRAQVINMSLGADGPCDSAYQDAVNQITAAGTTIVVAAGNSAGHAASAPANCVGVIAVAGLRHVGAKVGFSNLGTDIALSAPGGNCVNTTAGSPCLYPILTAANSGATTPAASIFTDSFNTSLGTSFSAPLVAGTAALMLSAQPNLTPLQVRLVLQATARPFPTTGGDNGDGTPVVACTVPQYDAQGNPLDQSQCYCTIDTCGAGMVDAGAAVAGARDGLAIAGVQTEGLWWALPGSSESGWGINLAQQGAMIFATWFTYDTNGRAWWLSMTASRTGSNPDTYTGQLIESRGPPLLAVPFDPNLVKRNAVGTATLVFNDVNRASFSYTVNGTQQSKVLTRLAFGPLPTCSYLTQPDFASATNFQDLWWATGAGESGWGLNLTQQGENMFVTWFTYDNDGSPLWLSATATRDATGAWSGALVRTTGPAFSATPFNPAQVIRTPVGNATITFGNGNAATFAYTVNGTSQSKTISRLLFAAPAGTVCRS